MIDIFFLILFFTEARHYFHENFAPYDLYLKKALRLVTLRALRLLFVSQSVRAKASQRKRSQGTEPFKSEATERKVTNIHVMNKLNKHRSS